jgi:hypothetical protein
MSGIKVGDKYFETYKCDCGKVKIIENSHHNIPYSQIMYGFNQRDLATPSSQGKEKEERG